MTSTYAIRGAIAAVLSAGYAAHYPPDGQPVVSDHLGPSDPPSTRTALLTIVDVEPPSVACPSGRKVTLTVYVVTPLTAPGAGDDDVDELLDTTLTAFDAAGVVWTTAVRGVWADQYPCYLITVEEVA